MYLEAFLDNVKRPGIIPGLCGLQCVCGGRYVDVECFAHPLMFLCPYLPLPHDCGKLYGVVAGLLLAGRRLALGR